jgi:uncharacterized protein (DUF58 family)
MTTPPRQPFFDSAFLRKLDRLALTVRRPLAGDMQGERRSPRRGASVEFADFRPYVIGDDVRQIDWNLYARVERFFLKLFVAEEELTVHLLVDSSASMHWGEPDKSAYARRVAGAFGYMALSSLDRVTLTAFGGPAFRQMPGVRGKRGALPLFDFLQSLPAGTTADLRALAHRYIQTARRPGPLLFCSDLMDPYWEDALKTLSSRPFEITVVHVLAPQELRPDLDGDFRLIDSENGTVVEVTADAELLRQYRRRLEAWQQQIETFCSGRNITYIPADTAVPVEEFILSELRRQGVTR